jgi:hypothetical protein
VILRILDRRKGLTEREFDTIFSDWKLRQNSSGDVIRSLRGPKLRFMSGKYIMGSFMQPGDWAKWLQLTQAMQGEDLVTTRKYRGHVRYKITQKGKKFLSLLQKKRRTT